LLHADLACWLVATEAVLNPDICSITCLMRISTSELADV
jgi:hypothetical protein